MSLPLSLPTLQNWSCHSCGNCCRHHQILVSDAERQRILDQKWTVADGVPEGNLAFAKAGGGRYRLAHRADGACVFLDERNRCRIHAKFGEAAKPSACRIYPFAFHPTGERSMAVAIRFDCPSAAASHGAPLSEQRRELQALRDLAVPERDDAWKAPRISAGQQLDWPDTLQIVRRFRQMICQPDNDARLATRLIHALFVAGMLGRATFDKVRGERLEELLDTLATCAPHETVAASENLPPPSSLALAQFRLTVAQYAVRDTLADTGLFYRIGKALAGLRFTRGKGETPEMQPGLGRVPFSDLERPATGNAPEIDVLLERYFDVKLTGMGFCGLGCHGLNVVEGFQNLALLYPVAMYLGRWFARTRNIDAIAGSDVRNALSAIDHHHERSPLMAWGNFRNRVKWLAEKEEIGKLIGWYAR
ncbi:MAG TPA: YkgJ family cysteine cluster protein [Tepidisphaeraceae bacterium]